MNKLLNKVLPFLIIFGFFSCTRETTVHENSSSNKGILDLYPKSMMSPILSNYKFGSYQWGEKDIKPFTPLTLLWFSDIHENRTNLERIREFYDCYKEYIDDVLCTGDVSDGTYHNNISYWKKGGGSPFLSVIGNHDAADVLSPFTPVSINKTYDKFIAPYLNETGVVCNKNESYWYKDYTFAGSSECKAGIRLIALDQYHWKEEEWSGAAYDDGCAVDNGKQERWFVTLLNDAIAKGFAIIVTIHGPSNDTQCIPIECSFDSLDRCTNRAYATLRTDLLDDVQDFIDKGGEFICWLCGHVHQDWFTQIKGYPDQLQITVGTASYDMMWRDLEMTYYTKYMDRFNIFNVEPEKKFIRMFRIGVNYDRHGRRIESIVYDYSNKKIIYN